MIQFESFEDFEEDFEFDHNQIQHLADCIKNANHIYIYGNYHEMNSMKKINYLAYKMKKDIVFLNTWAIEDSYSIINDIKSNDMIVIIDTQFNAQTFHYITLTNSHMINFDLINDKKCHKFFIGSDGSDEYMDFNIIYCPYINNYQSNILLQDLDDLLYKSVLERMK